MSIHPGSATVLNFLLEKAQYAKTEIIVAGRTMLNTILNTLRRIAYNDDPLKLIIVESTYQPFVSFFHQTEIALTFLHAFTMLPH
jgi:hypothetical protein